MIPNSVPTLHTTCECCPFLRFSFSCDLPKGGQGCVVWVGLLDVQSHPCCALAHIPHRAPHPTHYSCAPEGSGGDIRTYYIVMENNFSLYAFLRVCINAGMYMYVCVCLCARTFPAEHPTHSPAWPAPGSRWMF